MLEVRWLSAQQFSTMYRIGEEEKKFKLESSAQETLQNLVPTLNGSTV
jgi:hypothetical protein